MVKDIFTAIFFLVMCFIVMINCMSCSDVGVEPNVLPTLESEEKIDLTDPKLKSKDETIGGSAEPQLQNAFFLKEQYEKNCHESVWFFCPPSIFSDEIWEFELITDICVENYLYGRL